MKHFTNIDELKDLHQAIDDAIKLKSDPRGFKKIGDGKRLVMLFFNPSLRTRLSTEVAASNLGLDISILNVKDSWNLEFEDGAVMNLNTSEHIKEAAKVISLYADIIGVRAFPGLKSLEEDKADKVISSFRKYATVPVISLEGATAHPLQALADAITITEHARDYKPKVVLSWAPHPKPLPHAVANSFIGVMKRMDVELSITHPPGLELDPDLTKGVPIFHQQEQALKEADFVYVKNWSSYNPYGQVVRGFEDWMITAEKLGKASFMHCLPVRRNVVVEDAVLDGPQSLVLAQSENRIYSAQYVMKKLLEME